MDVEIPKRNSLDWVCSIKSGWDPGSNQEPTYSFGRLTSGIDDYRNQFFEIIEKCRNFYPHLLVPISVEVETGDYPEIKSPIEEAMIGIDPKKSSETGLFPKSALWQSGWDQSFPYVFVRQNVYDKLIHSVKTLREIDSKLNLVITDGWRSTEMQKQLYEMFYPKGHVDGEPLYVSPPDLNGKYGAPHTSGGAVDVLLGYESKAFRLGSDLDQMDKLSNTSYFENSNDLNEKENLIRGLRRIFLNVFYSQDFVSIDSEWWHIEFGTRRWAKQKRKEPLYGLVKPEDVDFESVSAITQVVGSKRKKMLGL